MQSGLGAISLKKKMAPCKKKIGTVKKARKTRTQLAWAHPQSGGWYWGLLKAKVTGLLYAKG